MSIQRIQSGPRMSQAVIHGKTVYLAGHVASGDGVAAQTRGILAQMNGIWDGWVTAGATPARATVESARLAAAEFKVEIAVIAAQI